LVATDEMLGHDAGNLLHRTPQRNHVSGITSLIVAASQTQTLPCMVIRWGALGITAAVTLAITITRRN
jgi:hypothetical protein